MEAGRLLVQAFHCFSGDIVIAEERSARMGGDRVKAAYSSSVNVIFRICLRSGREERREIACAALA